MTGQLAWLDGVTLAFAILLAFAGVAGRVGRAVRLLGIGRALTSDEDRDYLRSVQQSNYLRLYVKFVMLCLFLAGLYLVGRSPLLLEQPAAFFVLRLLGISVVGALLLESNGTDRTRDNLGRSAARAEQMQAQQDRMEAVGLDISARLTAGDIGRDETAVITRAQGDRMEATGLDSNQRLRRSAIGDSERAVVDKEQADEIQRVGDDSNLRLRDIQDHTTNDAKEES